MPITPSRAAAAGRLSQEAAGAYLSRLFERHGRMVYGVCRLRLRDRMEAEDAAQQTFLSAYRSILAGHEPREPAAWLGTIARNECRSRMRTRMREPLALVEDSEAAGGDIEQVAGRRAEVAALCEALGELPEQQREAIVLREFYGLSHEEVGVAIGVSASAVDALLVRARRRLQNELRPKRVASGVVALPLALRDSLAHAIPGFSPAGGGGLLAKLSSLPVAAKLAGAAATVALVGGMAASQPRRAEGSGAEPASGIEEPRAGRPAEAAAVFASRGDAPEAPRRVAEPAKDPAKAKNVTSARKDADDEIEAEEADEHEEHADDEAEEEEREAESDRDDEAEESEDDD